MVQIRKRKKRALPSFPAEVETDLEELERQRRIDTDNAREQARESRLQSQRASREDVNEFCQFVGRDSLTNKSIKQELIHEDFQLLADVYNRLIVMAHPESGKTTQLATLRVLSKLGNNPALRVCIVSKTKPNATKTTRVIKQYIEKSNELAEVFPEMVPGDVWSDASFSIRRPVFSKDPSVQAQGLDGSPTGDRIDLLIFDDILDLENTSTPAERKKTLRRIRGKFMDRLSDGAEVLFLTNAWHPKDAAHVLEEEAAKEDGPWFVARFPIQDEEGNLTWPDKWTLERVEEKKGEMGPLDFARAFRCRARHEGESPFDEDAVEACIQFARDQDIELCYEVQWHDMPLGACVFTGVDLAVSKSTASHLTTLVSVLLWPDDNSRQLLWVEAGRYSTREIRDRVIDHHRRYGSIFIVENNAAQAWIMDIIYNQDDLEEEDRVLPTLVPFTTGRNKAHSEFGVEGISAEMAVTKWLLPMWGDDKAAIQAKELKSEVLHYTRGAHTGDRLMGLWFAREGCRRGARAGSREGDRDHSGQSSGGVSIVGDSEGEEDTVQGYGG